MFLSDLYRSTFGYHFWANGQLIKHARLVDANEFFEALGVGHGSLHATLVHILQAEHTWLSLIQFGGMAPSPLNEAELTEIDQIAERWKVIEVATFRYLDKANDSDFAAVIDTEDQNGIVTPLPRWRMVQQILYHSAHHRTEAALILTHLGHPPGNLDFLDY